MTKQYKISEEQYFPLRKKINYDIILFILIFIITPIVIGLYNHQTKPWIWAILLLSIGSVGLQIIGDYFLRKINRKMILDDYSLTITDNAIIQRIPVPKSSLINSQPIPQIKRIAVDSISAIKKTANGSFIIIENEESHLNFILVPAQMEHLNGIEAELNKIYPITKLGALEPDLREQTFIIPEGGFRKFKNHFLSLMIPTVVIMVAILIFLIYPDNKNGWITLWTILGFGLFLIIWALLKMLNRHKTRYTDYRFTIDERLVIQENIGFVTAIPINKIIKIQKSFEGILSIIGNTSINIPAEIANKKVLETELSKIKPITKSRFSRRN